MYIENNISDNSSSPEPKDKGTRSSVYHSPQPMPNLLLSLDF